MARIELYKEPEKIEIVGWFVCVNGRPLKFEVRKLKDLYPVLHTRIEYKNIPVYFMYRNIYSTDDIRYDITIIPPKIIGKEYAKTFGHFHPYAEKELTYPEVCHVIRGSCKFLLEKKNSDYSMNVLLVSAKEGDTVLIPPNYGHVTINDSKTTLIMANLVSTKFQSDYEEYEKNNGGAYYLLMDGLVQNPNKIVKNFDRISAMDVNKMYKFESTDIFREFINDKEKFSFLNKPSMLFKKR